MLYLGRCLHSKQMKKNMTTSVTESPGCRCYWLSVGLLGFTGGGVAGWVYHLLTKRQQIKLHLNCAHQMLGQDYLNYTKMVCHPAETTHCATFVHTVHSEDCECVRFVQTTQTHYFKEH